MASLCNRLYRTKFMDESSLALIPEKGFYKGNQSRIALAWLGREAEKDEVFITHAGLFV